MDSIKKVEQDVIGAVIRSTRTWNIRGLKDEQTGRKKQKKIPFCEKRKKKKKNSLLFCLFCSFSLTKTCEPIGRQMTFCCFLRFFVFVCWLNVFCLALSFPLACFLPFPSLFLFSFKPFCTQFWSTWNFSFEGWYDFEEEKARKKHISRV